MHIKNKNQIYLLAINVALVFFLIFFSNIGMLPFGKGDFAFFAFLTFLVALFRPSWGFLFFFGTMVLENINLAPTDFGIAVRPYQLLGGLTILSLTARFFTRRLSFSLIKFTIFDWAAILLGMGSLLSIANAPMKEASLKQVIIMISYIVLYFLVRNFLQTKEDLKKVLPFFLSSSIVVVFYAIWQNIQFLQGGNHFEVMPGRPNATFTEPDWLGIYLSLLLALVYSLIFYFYKKKDDSLEDSQISNFKFPIIKTELFLFLVMVYIALIITVARSAWLGAFFVTFIFLFAAFTQLKVNYGFWQWKETFKLKMKIALAFILSLVVVYAFQLTNFQLINRIQSTGSGQQRITVSCVEEKLLESKEWDDKSLQEAGCRHINLEEIEKEKMAGNFIQEVYRKDPNINIRSEIYAKSWEIIKNHPFLGIGWGSVSSFLGKDAQGNGLNASNIFLEVWLGAGMLGLAAFVFLLFGALRNGIYFFAKQDRFFGMFILLGLVAVIVPNLFNSGIFLGFLWVFLGLAFIKK
ncbi:MAG TPA: hypothetical protein DIC35_04925 [Candidatus Moranbacteria bacterium]|nr:hypothetical protein [Candidatus Moranbacteria bacterium]